MQGQAQRWIVAKTKPSRDFWAAENVARQGYGFYLPKIYVRNKRYARAEPLFPSHLFVLVEGSWRFLLSTFGVSGVMLQGSEPAIVATHEIDRLRRLEGADGFIELPGTDKFKNGEKVRVLDGPMEGRVGVYQGQTGRERVLVLFDFLGRKTPMLIDERALESEL